MVADNRTVPVIEGIRQVDEHIPHVRVQGIAARVDAKPVVARKIACAVRRVADARPRVAGHVAGVGRPDVTGPGNAGSRAEAQGYATPIPGGAGEDPKTNPPLPCG